MRTDAASYGDFGLFLQGDVLAGTRSGAQTTIVAIIPINHFILLQVRSCYNRGKGYGCSMLGSNNVSAPSKPADTRCHGHTPARNGWRHGHIGLVAPVLYVR